MLSKRMRPVFVGLGSVLAFVTAHVLAHHGPIGPSLYNTDDLFVVEGELTDIFWRSPHVRFAVTEVSESGEETVWEIELAPGPRELEGDGVTPDLFPLGGHVRVGGFVSRWNSRTIGMRSMLFPDGTEYTGDSTQLVGSTARVQRAPRQAAEPGDAAAAEQPDGIFRAWRATMRPSEWAALNEYDRLLTPRAAQAKADWDPATHPVLDCVPRGFPENMVNASFTFVPEGDTIVMARGGGSRVIHMGPDVAPPGTEHSHLGYSTGRWEGDTLVVRTTHVNWPYFDRDGTPQSDRTVFVERFTMSADGSNLDHAMTATDPANFIEPIVTTNRYSWRPGAGTGAGTGAQTGSNAPRCELWDITEESG